MLRFDIMRYITRQFYLQLNSTVIRQIYPTIQYITTNNTTDQLITNNN